MFRPHFWSEQQMNCFSLSPETGIINSPNAAVFAAPEVYGAPPLFAEYRLASHEVRNDGSFFRSPQTWPGQMQTPRGRRGASASTVSPLTPVPASTLGSPFFPTTAAADAHVAHPPYYSYTPRATPWSSVQVHESPRRTAFHHSAPSFSFAPSQAGPDTFASAPPFRRGHGKRESVSVAALRTGDDPLRSPTLSRTTSLSLKKEAPAFKRKKVVVRLPREGSLHARETPEADDDSAPSSSIRRVPLSNGGLDELETKLAVRIVAVSAATREQHPDEIKPLDLPPAIDVYLPGKEAWEDVWEAFEQELNERSGHYTAQISFFRHNLRSPSDSGSPLRGEHRRAASLISPSRPSVGTDLSSTLQTPHHVGTGHISSLSLALPSGFAPVPCPPSFAAAEFSAPFREAVPSRRQLTPLAKAFVPRAATLERAATIPLPLSPPAPLLPPDQAFPAAAEDSQRPWITLEESQHQDSDGIGLDESDTAPAQHVSSSKPASPRESATPPSPSPVAARYGDAVESESPTKYSEWPSRAEMEAEIDARRSGSTEREDSHAPPLNGFGAEAVDKANSELDACASAAGSIDSSRRASGVSTKTDRTGVASHSMSGGSWSEASEEDVITSDLGSQLVSDPIQSHHKLPTLDQDANLPPNALQPRGSQDGRSPDEYSNPSDEEAAEEGRAARLRPFAPSRTAVVEDEDEDDKPLAMLVSGASGKALHLSASIGVGNADTERPVFDESTTTPPTHRSRPSFTFPPATSPDTKGREGQAAALSHKSSIDSQYKNGHTTQAHVASAAFRRTLSNESCPEPPAFGPLGEPGSLAGSANHGRSSSFSASSTTPNVNNPAPRSVSALSPTGFALQPTAPEFKPSQWSSSLSDHEHRGMDSMSESQPVTDPLRKASVADEAAGVPAGIRHVSGSHGPLPPIPLTTVALHSVGSNNHSVKDDTSLAALDSTAVPHSASALVLAHPQPRRPLPDPPLMIGYDGSPETAEDNLRDARDGVEGAQDSGDHSFISSHSVDDPLPEQYAPLRRVTGSRTAMKSLGATAQTVNTCTRQGGASAVAARMQPIQASPARMGDPRARQESIDIALPSSQRAKSKAIALNQTRLDKVISASDDGSWSSVIEEDEDDLPLHILENHISALFDDLKRELIDSRAAVQPDIQEQVEDLAQRVVRMIDARMPKLPPQQSELERRLEETHSRLEQLVALLFRREVEVGTTICSPSAVAGSAVLEDLEYTVQPRVHRPPDSAIVMSVLRNSAQPQGLAASGAISASSSQATVAEPFSLEKVNESFSSGQLKHLAESIAEEVVARIQSLSTDSAPLDRLGETVEGHVAEPRADQVSSTLKALRTGQVLLAELASLRSERSRTPELRLNGSFEQLLREVPPVSLADVVHRLNELEIQLDQARKDCQQACSDTAAAQARLEAHREHHDIEVAELRKQLAARSEWLGRAEDGKKEARENLAMLRGENAALQQRLLAQDERLEVLRRAKSVQQQALSRANQRNVEHEAALNAARARISELEAASSAADAKVNALDEQNVAYRGKLAAIQHGLEAMKVAVQAELDEASSRIAQLSDERDRLAAENERLVQAACDKAPTTPRQAPGPHVLWPSLPSPVEVAHRLEFRPLSPQRTGLSALSDETVAHTEFSPAPSVSGRSIVRDENEGWWSAVAA